MAAKTEYAYEKLMTKHDLSLSDLPDSAKDGIQEIKKIERAINLTLNKGRKVSNLIYKKVERMDTWVTRDVLDWLDDKDPNHGVIPNTADEVIKTLEEETAAAEAEKKKQEDLKKEQEAAAEKKRLEDEQVSADKKALEEKERLEKEAKDKKVEENIEEKPDPTGIKIDEQFKVMFDSGKHEYSLEEIKTAAPTAHAFIFDNYDQAGDNGIETTYYSLLEMKENVFTLTKK